MKPKNPAKEKIKEKASKEFKGYPIATIACYGPDKCGHWRVVEDDK